MTSFDSLGLHPSLLKALQSADYTEPTPIQSKAIPKIVRGFDIRASAQTGTGKTAAFLLPLLNRLTYPRPQASRGPRALILVPTRELAMQVAHQAEKYSRFLNRIKTVCVVGGVPYPAQQRQLSRPYDLLIATPGRLIDFLDRKKINLSHVEVFVLDEADRMLDMGFVEPVERIASALPTSRQTLLFSATLAGSVQQLSERIMNKPMDIKIHSDQAKHENITQKLHLVDNLGHKNRILEHILQEEQIEYAIIFTSTKRHVEQLAGELYEKGHSAAPLHGDMNQRQRSRTLAQLRSGKIKILVATDVAARGIDVQLITHVINFDMPNNTEDYVHRIGRTGRAGAQGTALSFAAHRDTFLVKKIEQFTGQQINVVEIAGLEPRAKPNHPKKRPFRGGYRKSYAGRR